jgi:hypothetical protein
MQAEGFLIVWLRMWLSGHAGSLALPQVAVDALKLEQERQEATCENAGKLWQEHGLVFTTQVGTALDAANVRQGFKKITKAAWLGEEWTPRELRAHL